MTILKGSVGGVFWGKQMKENIPRAPYLAQDERANLPSCLYALGRLTRSYVCAPATARVSLGLCGSGVASP